MITRQCESRTERIPYQFTAEGCIVRIAVNRANMMFHILNRRENTNQWLIGNAIALQTQACHGVCDTVITRCHIIGVKSTWLFLLPD